MHNLYSVKDSGIAEGLRYFLCLSVHNMPSPQIIWDHLGHSVTI